MNRGYAADRRYEALKAEVIRTCIYSRKSSALPIKYDKRRYKRRNRTKVLFGKLKDWWVNYLTTYPDEFSIFHPV